MKRIIIRVQWDKRKKWWKVRGVGISTEYDFKHEAVARAVDCGRAIAAQGGLAQVVSHRKDGVIQWERTYPRSSDPRRSRG